MQTGVIISAAASSILWNWDLKIFLRSVQNSYLHLGTSVLWLSSTYSVKISLVSFSTDYRAESRCIATCFVLCKADWENSRLLKPEATQPELDELVRPETKDCAVSVCVALERHLINIGSCNYWLWTRLAFKWAVICDCELAVWLLICISAWILSC